MPIPVYTKNGWVDDDGSGTTGTTLSAARMNAQEDALVDASLRTRVVRTASRVNMSLAARAGSILVISGVTLSTVGADRFLLTGQSEPSENGIYVATYSAATTSWSFTRATDFNSADQIRTGQIIVVSEGNYASQHFVVQTDNPTVGGLSILIVGGPPAWVTLNLASGWSNANVNLIGAAMYYRDASDRVYVKAAITGTAINTLAFTMPWGPNFTEYFSVLITNGAAGGYLYIDNTGAVYVNQAATGNTAYINFSYRAMT